jgi:hypothetical protein
LAVQQRPPTVTDWSDLNDVLLGHADRLVAVLGPGWETEGPLFEADELRVDISRLLRDDPSAKEQIYLSVSLGFPTSHDDPPTPPERLSLNVSFDESNHFHAPSTTMARIFEWLVSGVWVAATLGAAAAVLYFVKNRFLGILAALVTLIVVMFLPIVAMGFIGHRSSQRQRRRERPKPPSPEFLAAIEAVRRVLSDPRHGVVDLREGA